MRSNASGGEGGNSAPDEGSQRPRRHSLEFLVAGSATCGGSQNQNSSPGDIPPTPSSSCSGSSRSGGQRSRGSPSPQGRQSPGLAPLSSASSSSRTTPPTSSMPHGLTVQELKEMTKVCPCVRVYVYVWLHFLLWTSNGNNCGELLEAFLSSGIPSFIPGSWFLRVRNWTLPLGRTWFFFRFVPPAMFCKLLVFRVDVTNFDAPVFSLLSTAFFLSTFYIEISGVPHLIRDVYI